MSYSKEEIAKNIEDLRNSKGLKQEDFANKLNVSRPTVSNWEQAKNLPTTDQLIQIAQTFCVSIDELLGLKKAKKIMVIVDSSILCRRPRILDDMKGKDINYICITETVLAEMNHQKDCGKRRQQAWLAMKSFNDLRKEDEKRFLVLKDIVSKNDELNDNKIINVARLKAKEDPSLIVFLVAEDIYFPLKAASTLNFKVLNLEDYEREFSIPDEDFSSKDTNDFYDAVKNGNILDAERIKKKNPDINHTDPKTGYTPCIQAIRNKDKKMLEYLISLPETDLNKCDDVKYRLPPISHAVQIKNLEFIKILLQNGADIDKGSQGTNYGNTALMIASWHGELDIVKYLVEQGACCNQQDFNGYTPLIKACIRKNPEVAKYLFDKTDLNIHSRYENKTAKDYALQINDPDLNKKFAEAKNHEECK
jgi:ankyrin repeat protein/DNA-binding XRE family transcriptional regulator